MHAQIEALDLSPKLKERLLAMSERELKRTLANNGNYIYEDLSGPQKRATWNLLRAIADEYGIDLDAGVESHEHVQAKTIGEGENAEEMVDTMRSWPAKVEELGARLAEARAAGAPDGYLADLEDELAEQRANLAAVDADKTLAENNALEGERILGEPGAAAAREERRNAFWDAFYDNMERLDALLATPIPGGSGPRVS